MRVRAAAAEHGGPEPAGASAAAVGLGGGGAGPPVRAVPGGAVPAAGGSGA